MIDRPAGVVWNFIIDLSNSKWDPYCLEARQTSAGPIGVGATFQLIRSKTPKVHDLRVIQYDPGALKMTIESTSGPAKGTKQQFSMETIEGKTRLTRTFDLKYSGFYKLLGPFSTGMLKREATADLENIKRMVESKAQS
jgi:hypothetical protein